MKLNKAQAIARRNQELGGAVLGVNNCHFTDLDRKRNIWWFDLPVGRIAVGQYEWIHLLMHNAETDQLLHLKVPTVDTDMSLGVSVDDGRLEYSSLLQGLFGQRFGGGFLGIAAGGQAQGEQDEQR